MARQSDWGPFLDHPMWKELKRVLIERREDAVSDCVTLKPYEHQERIARAQERIRELDWLIGESFTQGE